MKSYLLAVVALVFLAGVCRAEDWTTTDGKTYKSVTVLKHDAVSVTILDDDGGASVPLANLSPDLQKRFAYDPVKAAATQQAQASADAKASQAQAQQASQRQATASAQANPVEMIGTVSEAKASYYTVTCLGLSDMLPSGLMTVADYWQSNPKNQKAPNLAMPTGGDATLISSTQYTVGQTVDIVVYPAGVHLTGGDKYAQFSDDAGTAANLAQGK